MLKFNPVVYEVFDEDQQQVLGDIVVDCGVYVFQTQEGWQFTYKQLCGIKDRLAVLNSGEKA